jgi:hypothetical protein
MSKWDFVEYTCITVAILLSFSFGFMRGSSAKDAYYKPILIENNLAEYRSDDKGEPVFIVKDSK